MRTPLLVLLSTLPFLASCQTTRYGSGVRTEQNRAVGEFDGVLLAVPARVNVTVGESTSLTIAGDDNLVPDIRSEVDGSQLQLEIDGNIRPRVPLEVTITCPNLSELVILGSGDVTLSGCRGDGLTLGILGSGSVAATGDTDRLAASIRGSGDLRLAALSAREADLEIAGSGSMDVAIRERLDYSISGSGSILYRGTPHVSGRVSGSGSITRRR